MQEKIAIRKKALTNRKKKYFEITPQFFNPLIKLLKKIGIQHTLETNFKEILWKKVIKILMMMSLIIFGAMAFYIIQKIHMVRLRF